MDKIESELEKVETGFMKLKPELENYLKIVKSDIEKVKDYDLEQIQQQLEKIKLDHQQLQEAKLKHQEDLKPLTEASRPFLKKAALRLLRQLEFSSKNLRKKKPSIELEQMLDQHWFDVKADLRAFYERNYPNRAVNPVMSSLLDVASEQFIEIFNDRAYVPDRFMLFNHPAQIFEIEKCIDEKLTALDFYERYMENRS